MSKKHTPGPWTVYDSATDALYIDAPERMVAKMLNGAERFADARLIAAAPELLEAAKAIIAQIDAALLPDDPQTAALRDAIAKAEG